MFDVKGLIILNLIYKQLEKYFKIRKFLKEENPKPKQKNHFSLYLEKEWHELVLKNEFSSNDPIKGLDVEILTDLVISPIFGIILHNKNNINYKILGIKDIRNDERIDFVGGIRGLKELERRLNIQ